MSRQNKVNKDNYTQSGRLTPDEMARERRQQETVRGQARTRENIIWKTRSTPAAPGSTRRRTEREESE
jgi:hypothetical protein